MGLGELVKVADMSRGMHNRSQAESGIHMTSLRDLWRNQLGQGRVYLQIGKESWIGSATHQHMDLDMLHGHILELSDGQVVVV